MNLRGASLAAHQVDEMEFQTRHLFQLHGHFKERAMLQLDFLATNLVQLVHTEAPKKKNTLVEDDQDSHL